MTDLEHYRRVLHDAMDAMTPGVEEPAHTWAPIDLIAVAADPPPPPTIGGLVYPGRRHLFSGEPEALKSWAAMVLCVEEIRAGNAVAYIDFEMGKHDTLSRVRDLGLTDDEVRAGFIYIEPDEPFTDPMIRADTAGLLVQRQPTLIVIDAMTGVLQVHGLDPNKGVDIESFYRGVVDPLRSTGAAVVVLDHLTKDPTARGRFAIGSERKVGGVEVHLGFEVIHPFGRGRIGKAKIVTHKDRPGYLHRPRAAELELSSSAAGDVTWNITYPEGVDPDAPAYFRPTRLMEKVSRYLEERDEEASMNQIESNVSGNAEYVRRAAAFLVEDGYANESSGPRSSRLFISIRQYREPTSSTSSDLVPTSSGRSGETTSSTSSPPYRGTRVVGDEDEDDFGHDLVQTEDGIRIPYSSMPPGLIYDTAPDDPDEPPIEELWQ